MLQKHRAVGGLISLIGIVIVFGITSVAYIELSSTQTNLIIKSLDVNKKISDRNNERLNFTDIKPNDDDEKYTVSVSNLGSSSVTIDSHITKNQQVVVGKKDINTTIVGGSSKTIDVQLDKKLETNDQIIFVTELGKKCLIPVGVSFRVC